MVVVGWGGGAPVRVCVLMALNLKTRFRESILFPRIRFEFWISEIPKDFIRNNFI